MDSGKPNPLLASVKGTGHARVVREFLQANPSVEFIRCQWQDLSGILRVRVVTKTYAAELALGNKPLQSAPLSLHCLADNSYLPFSPGVHYLYPDWTSLRRTTDNYGMVMCAVVESITGEQTLNMALCPRQTLTNVLRAASDQYGLRFLVGFEIEFCIVSVSSDGDILPASSKIGRCAALGMREPHFRIVEECVRELQKVGLKINTFHIEGNSGQYEIPLAPLPPMQAVDQLILAHDVLKTTVARHGCVATMSPRPGTGQQSNGQHVHISLDPPDNEESFLAGLLESLPMLCAFGLPYEISYERVKEFEAGRIVGWGTENRAFPIRKIEKGHWELRFVDATSNMYLTLSAIIAAGIRGLQDQRLCRWPDASIRRSESPFRDPIEFLPVDFESALMLLEKCMSSLDKSIDRRIIRHYLRIKRQELSRLRTQEAKSIRTLLALLF
ncbi:hypothetical protein BDV59DRAFT_196998 [Aspergillus ambiguus]|uniref:uncharacterized protein n=1 Tax=Aspergillus ambiguus TaxID=176160 RepID=UPI003CCD82A3